MKHAFTTALSMCLALSATSVFAADAMSKDSMGKDQMAMEKPGMGKDSSTKMPWAWTKEWARRDEQERQVRHGSHG
jgi:pentapeptide MXKDX repeat protein